jgi:hydroxyacylglutathione hydrolase
MELLALPAFADNYIWMLHDGASAIVVDPGDAAPVRQALAERSLKLAAIVVTHHHADHVGGVDALRDLLDGPVLGPARERIPEPFTPLAEGDVVELLGLRFEVLDVPGHTAGHIAYFGHVPGQAPLLFCGDTLFSAGCGRLFEGSPAQMHASLAKLAALPGNTRVCCAHEYTVSNLRFAQAVEPANAAVIDHLRACQAQRERGVPTLPSSVAQERRINPFLRTTEPEVVLSAQAHGAHSAAPTDILAALRQWKNEFR